MMNLKPSISWFQPSKSQKENQCFFKRNFSLLFSSSVLTQYLFLNIRTLPNTCLKRDNDICLIVKDLEKGWKKDHEPSMHHYKELLAKKGIDFVDEVHITKQFLGQSVRLNFLCLNRFYHLGS